MGAVRRRLAALVLALGVVLVGAAPVGAQAPEWLEPQALNIVDIVGQVPDDVLRDNIVSYYDGAGITQFVSSERAGDLLRITVRAFPRAFQDAGRWISRFPTLAQIPAFDHVYSTMPASWVRVWAEDGSEITGTLARISYVEPPLPMPETDSSAWTRYPSRMRDLSLAGAAPTANGVPIPANVGGSITIPGDHRRLTVTFTVTAPNAARVTYLGASEATFGIFIGDLPREGDMGTIRALVEQLQARYATRHPRIPLNAPADANYVMFTYPPSDYDIYAPDRHNLERPMGGTVRLAPDMGMLSQNLTHGGAFPLRAAWQDADQSAGPLLSLLPPVHYYTPPEYFIPAGWPYDPCFQSGGCSTTLLDAIYNAQMPIRAIFLSVQPNASQSVAVPLRFMDDPALPRLASLQGVTSQPASAVVPSARVRQRLFVPLARTALVVPVTERPAGFFERTTGRMVGYVP